MRSAALLLLHAALLLLLAALPVSAQQNLLDRADSLLNAGQYALARTALTEWQRANPITAKVDAAQRARSHYLSARLSTDAEQARQLYLMIALSHPTAREAPDALLRLGQSFLAAGDTRSATTYFGRLINDYPTASARGLGYVWLSRAQLVAGDPTLACTTATAGLNSQNLAPEIITLLLADQRSACTGQRPDSQQNVTGAARPTAAPTVPQPQPVRSEPPRDTSASTPRPSDARFAVQTSAFREVRSANAIAAQLRRNGFDSRVAYVPGSELARVRIGRFRTRAEAQAEVNRLKAKGLSGIVVDDAARERRQR
jgi:cell division septation protein DedD